MDETASVNSHPEPTMHRHWPRPAARMLASQPDGAAPVSPPAIVGPMNPAHLLQEDEIVLVLTKPSVLWIFYSCLPFLIAITVLGVVLVKIAGTTLWFAPSTVAWLTAAVAVTRLLWSLLTWTSHTYMLTNRRIVTIKGVVNVHMFQTPLRRIQNTQLYRPLGQRLFSAGTIGFSTAAAAGSAESTWIMIAHPQEIHAQIIAAIERAR